MNTKKEIESLRAQSAEPAGEYPALPYAAGVVVEHLPVGEGWVRHERRQSYTADQMRAYADATCAMRATQLENLHCKSTQKRLATQWGFVPAGAQQPAPAEVVYSTPEEMFDAILTPQPSTTPQAAPKSFLEIPDVQDESGIKSYYSRELVLECINAALASHGQAPAQAAPAAVARPSDLDLLAEWDRVSTIAEAGERRLAVMRAVLAKWGAAPTTQPAPQQEAASVDLKTMELAESVGLIGPASRTHDLHAAIQRFHDLICANATIKAAQMAAEAISESAPQADSATEPAAGAVAHTLSDAQIEAMPVWRNFVGLWPESRREIVDAVVDLLAATPTPPAQAADSALKDHQIAALVNELRDIAVQYHGTQQLRERIARVVVPALKAQAADSVLEDAAPTWRCQHCIDRHDGIYGSWAAPCPYHDDDGKPRIDAARAAQEGKSHGN